MPSRHARYSPVGDYRGLHIAAVQSAIAPVGRGVSTTSATTITAGTDVVVTPASMTHITVGLLLNFANGTGTGEWVAVKTTDLVGGTFTADFAYGHSGAYTIIGHRGTFIGPLTINQSGSGTLITLYNGHPSVLPAPTSSDAGVLAIVEPALANGEILYSLAADLGLFYTVSTGGQVGDYTLHYIDMPA
jgi:hypothetical protein